MKRLARRLEQAPVQAVASFVLMLASAALCFIPTDSSSVSLIDFHCYKPPESLKISKQEMVDECRKAKVSLKLSDINLCQGRTCSVLPIEFKKC